MFTGIVEAKGMVESIKNSRLSISRPSAFSDIAVGSSICVSGVCLSIVEFDENQMTFDVIPETLSKTTLGFIQRNDEVNLERALKADARFEGHIVQGHIETIAKVESVQGEEVKIILPKALKPFAVQKGSIAIDGVSLTIAKHEGDMFTVALIPHTCEHTTLGTLKSGKSVNIETDILGKYIISTQSL